MNTFKLARLRLVHDFFDAQLKSIMNECLDFEYNVTHNPESIQSFKRAEKEQWNRIEVMLFDFRIIRGIIEKYGNEVDKKETRQQGELISERIHFMED